MSKVACNSDTSISILKIISTIVICSIDVNTTIRASITICNRPSIARSCQQILTPLFYLVLTFQLFVFPTFPLVGVLMFKRSNSLGSICPTFAKCPTFLGHVEIEAAGPRKIRKLDS